MVPPPGVAGVAMGVGLVVACQVIFDDGSFLAVADDAEHDRGVASPSMDDSIEARLDELQRESQERRAELRALAADLPQATSRRAVLSAMVRSVGDAPDKPRVVRRVVLKVLRAPADLVRSLRT